SADLILRSSHGIWFFVRAQDLAAHSTIFSAAEERSSPVRRAMTPKGTDDSPLDIVDVTESSETLQLLLQFMRRQPQPNVAEMDFATLERLAEAAEKYEVYSATQLLKFAMRSFAKDYPSKVLLYASRHGYTDLAIDAA
ncbi:hypothetical protein BDV98DRAFT_482215, partial [Pterulicium gracile]